MRFVRFWVVGILREGVWHALAASLMWLALYRLLGPGHASVAVAMFWIGRELRDWEIEAGPGLWKALGFESEYPLSPAPLWSLEQFRHSLSGWIPVCMVMVLLYLWGGF